jgi:monoamine oxidase
VPATNVVVAVPIPALRQITFAPPLPPEKTAALEAISSAPALKVQCAFAGASGNARDGMATSPLICRSGSGMPPKISQEQVGS